MAKVALYASRWQLASEWEGKEGSVRVGEEDVWMDGVVNGGGRGRRGGRACGSWMGEMCATKIQWKVNFQVTGGWC